MSVEMLIIDKTEDYVDMGFQVDGKDFCRILVGKEPDSIFNINIGGANISNLKAIIGLDKCEIRIPSEIISIAMQEYEKLNRKGK